MDMGLCLFLGGNAHEQLRPVDRSLTGMYVLPTPFAEPSEQDKYVRYIISGTVAGNNFIYGLAAMQELEIYELLQHHIRTSWLTFAQPVIILNKS